MGDWKDRMQDTESKEFQDEENEYYCNEEQSEQLPAPPPAAKKKRGRPKKTEEPAPDYAEEQLDAELAQAEQTNCVTPEILEEEALRIELQGEGYTKEDFQKSPNYLVEAGAGAGKTFVMVQRIVNQLVSGFCQPEDIVAITFTNKSTQEMRERLDKFLSDRLRPLKQKADRGEPLTEEEQALLDRLEYLVRESGRMQVSTIHSFCQTLLEAMPFSSPLGLDMQVVESDEELAKAFLARKWREKNQPFDVPRQLGVKVSVLEKAFLSCCKDNVSAIAYTDVNSPDANQWKGDVKDAVHNLQAELYHLNLSVPGMRREIRSLMSMTPAAFAADLPAIRTLIWWSLTNPEHFPLDQNIKGEEKKSVWSSDDGEKVDAVWLGQWGQLLRKSGRCLVHSYVMRDVATLLEEYRQEKIARHIATYDDLLRHARDMLRDKPEARAYFHRRYKSVYVDEMQDTDPVQTELLFYLTAGEECFDRSDWKSCRPVPGSLFLVGDPKQAIYRFRGAGIGAYNDLLGVFQSREDRKAHGVNPNAVGEKVTLRFNFRSSAEICALADRVFAPAADEQNRKPYQFVGGEYHAEYVPMIARSGSCPRARILYNGSAHDVKRVAAFIRSMIDQKRLVGIHRPDQKDPQKGRRAHPAQAKDFLILTKEKKTAQKYAQALWELGVQAEVTGEKKFWDTVPIARAVLHLQSLLALRDNQRLMLVLRECYGIGDRQLRVFLQRTGESSLTGAVKRKKLEKIQLALEKVPGEADLMAVCCVLEEIAVLREMARTQPAMAVIEQLLAGGFGVWRGLEDLSLPQRKQIFSEVQQYLNLIRGSRERSFQALAAYAVACAERKFEHELHLEPTENAVRIMNLHKAKGLEAEIVILAYDWQKPHMTTRHVEWHQGKSTEFRVLQDGKWETSRVTVGCPKDWDEQCEEEEKYLEAEYARLLYVAATRAKTMLVICGKNSESEKPFYWQPLLSGLDGKSGEKTSDYYGQAFKVLSNLKSFSQQERKKAVLPQPAVPVRVDPAAMEHQIQQTAAALAENRLYAITPSQLNHHARGFINRKDEEEPETAVAAVTADAVDRSDENEETSPAAPQVDAAVAAEAADSGPYGPDWGTIVHRIMELAVRSRRFDETALKDFARQAVTEELPGGIVTASQRKMLRLEDVQSGEAVIACLADQAAGAAAFLSDETSQLRRQLEGAECYPELPFFLQEPSGDSELYRHLAAHAVSEKARGRTLAVEGIIDLAIRKGDAWYVVDYKTDKRRPEETEDEQFVQRLKEEYTPQITAYARVLERMGSGKVKKAWLCSITPGPLSGRFIELDIQAK